MDIQPGTSIRWYDSHGGWRWGTFVRVVHSRRGSTGIKREERALVQRGGSTEQVPLSKVRIWTPAKEVA